MDRLDSIQQALDRAVDALAELRSPDHEIGLDCCSHALVTDMEEVLARLLRKEQHERGRLLSSVIDLSDDLALARATIESIASALEYPGYEPGVALAEARDYLLRHPLLPSEMGS